MQEYPQQSQQPTPPQPSAPGAMPSGAATPPQPPAHEVPPIASGEAPSTPPQSPQAENFWQRWGGVLMVTGAIALIVLVIWFIFLTRSFLTRIQNGVPIDVSGFSQVAESSQLSGTSQDQQLRSNNAAASNFEDDPSFGPEDAKLTIVMFEDFECPYCGRAFPTIKQIMAKYASQVRFVYRDFPLSSIHPNAQKAAEAGQCAHEQGVFWEYHDLLYANQQALTVPDLKRYATRVGLNTEQFHACLDSGKYTDEVEADFADGLRAGVSGTPTFFFNGNRVQGVLPAEGFERLITHFLSQ